MSHSTKLGATHRNSDLSSALNAAANSMSKCSIAGNSQRLRLVNTRAVVCVAPKQRGVP